MIDGELINTLCAVALASPTKSDLQQRDIIILEDDQQRARVTSLFPDTPWIAQAPHLLIFCGNNRRQRQISQWRNKTFANDHLDAFFNASVDAGIALSAFVIAAEAIALGCCPISAIRNHAETISDMLQLPDHVFPVAGLAVGHPQEPPKISMRLPLKLTVHRNVFSEADIEQQVGLYDRQRASKQPYDGQRDSERFAVVDHYGWSEDKARQYARPERSDFGDFIRRKGFNLA
jgi:nitroreductase/FMN reductase [NAD(P)H]